MIFDINLFGMGAGLVTAGWIVGTLISMAFSVIKRLGNP